MNAFRKAFGSPLKKSPYGPAGMGLYSPADNMRRKMHRSSISANKPTASKQASQQAAADKAKSKKNPVKIYTQAEINHHFRNNFKVPRLTKVLSMEVTQAHHDWTEAQQRQRDRVKLHTLMMDPSHSRERGAMLRGLAMKVPTQMMGNERHYLLHRRHGPVEGNKITHPDVTSYSTHPKNKMKNILDGGNIHSAWIPENKISYSYEFSMPHHQEEPESGNGYEGEVIVGPGTYNVHDKFFQTSNMANPEPGHKVSTNVA